MPGVKRDFYDVCPDCWSVRIKHRVFKSPRYKCEKCGHEFPNKKRISYDDRKLFYGAMLIAKTELTDRKIPVNKIDLCKATVKTVKEHFKSCGK